MRETDGDKKIRVRTPEELELQGKGLIESKRIFEKLQIPYFLGAGTLLGAYRDKDFIPWDWDVQCYFLYEDVKEVSEQLITEFLHEGFELLERSDKKKNWKQVYRKYNTDYEYTSWYKKREWRYRSDFKLPDRFFSDAATIRFYGETFPCLAPIEEYLVFNYGDWKTPKKESNKEKYLNNQFYKYPYVIRKLKNTKYYIMNPLKTMNKIKNKVINS